MIRTVDLQFGYDDRAVLRGVDFRAESGDVTVLLGRNGAGKSTLLKHFNGLLEPDDGRVLVDGDPVRYDDDSLTDLRQTVGFVFQDPDDQLVAPTVGQDVAFGPINLGNDSEDTVQWALSRVGLDGYEDRLCSRLSGGEKKRVALAGVLAMKPSYLILDEPTAGLDGDGTRALVELIRELTAEGISFVVSTHYPDFAAAVGDSFTLLNDGEIACRASSFGEIPAREYGLRNFDSVVDP
ncbi:ABC transporter ATP-binding protein (plasmid) [Haloferax mediterranei ATCC 33500]|uniref:ABC transporter ATP-binding protein n=1 Tax=Haloferax mediterranei (strain ATCC 33500 / DSM 1411 / JCM 8866 / NBRC 14739 / NCIMB 2177 / R-4) TaxID=523841 RepID=I3R9J7_HALMT|nr:ABC transporter ATP-binding protein [Haloferax mediterranei]AFK20907.1 CbiO protein (ABC-type cobalt transport system ATP-binding protein) [Haloferax mediterranei ATCC 33500]AHZ24224.1 ABC transporter ATP-binding protein [Haloferax mediterranei ATCC 33500]EMA05303.1 CbiO protein (ABC-type cobalt transport system ATP-binding protein) [Haloferax mediterranei ATCC 33500]MDX5989895.1 ABC transporter ATP-binding protein [Haloferax mediterranei ATCC 33500]QCQ77336.1 ABC transporter ATP-binding pr